jgi:hypothetical protein
MSGRKGGHLEVTTMLADVKGIDLRATRAREALTADTCELIGGHRLNALLVGPAIDIDRVLDQLCPRLPGPILRLHPDEPIDLPSTRRIGTMILHDVGDLELDDQRLLFEWLDRTTSRPRVISTTRTPIIGRVASGRFLPALYYRLNLCYVDMGRADVDRVRLRDARSPA